MVNHWREGKSVPDITRPETQMGVYFLARKYIDTGIEAIHFGQVELIGLEDSKTTFTNWGSVLGRIRQYDLKHTRSVTNPCEAHVPQRAIRQEDKMETEHT